RPQLLNGLARGWPDAVRNRDQPHWLPLASDQHHRFPLLLQRQRLPLFHVRQVRPMLGKQCRGSDDDRRARYAGTNTAARDRRELIIWEGRQPALVSL